MKFVTSATYSSYTKNIPLALINTWVQLKPVQSVPAALKIIFLSQTSGCLNTQIWRHITNFLMRDWVVNSGSSLHKALLYACLCVQVQIISSSNKLLVLCTVTSSSKQARYNNINLDSERQVSKNKTSQRHSYSYMLNNFIARLSADGCSMLNDIVKVLLKSAFSNKQHGRF